MPRINFNCYNCGQANDHYSKNCPILDQQYVRCPECKNVAKTAAGHKITCKNIRFVSTKIGAYELPLMEFQKVRFTFKNVDEIFCVEEADNGMQTFAITKWYSIGTNIHLRRIYGHTQEIILDIKMKPAVTLGFGRINNSHHIASLMFCQNQVRVNRFQHIDH